MEFETIQAEIYRKLDADLYGDTPIDFVEWILFRKYIWSGAHNANFKKEEKAN